MKENITLREKKYAKTKKDILDSYSRVLKRNKGEEASVKETCILAEISEQTFFNYFPKKEDLMHYYAKLWSLDIVYHSDIAKKRSCNLEAIKDIFNRSANVYYRKNPYLIFELLKINSNSTIYNNLKNKKITLAEKEIFFPKFDGIEDFEAELDFCNIIKPFVFQAAKNDEIRKDNKINEVVLFLRSLFFGGAMSTGNNTDDLVKIYKKQLDIYLRTLK